MGPEEGGSVGSASASTGLFSGPDIAAQVQELEKRVAQQVGEDAYLCLAPLSSRDNEGLGTTFTYLYLYEVLHRQI